ncbi:unnamed protein product [Lactuca saligna]|uniref:Histone-lysine N-methyltransferase n=1 Tax=Lactuca saligna TaxID=75948 RepID=A0AA35Z011_LACSI|nr:unnamed protein product [Lactuca saligna]
MKRKGKEAETMLNTGVPSTLLTSDHRRRPSSPIQVPRRLQLIRLIMRMIIQDSRWFKQKSMIFFASRDICKKRRQKNCIAASKKRRRLLPYSPSEDPARRLEQMASLATTLTTIEAEFSNVLTYIHGMALRSPNRPAYEKEGMQVLSREDTEAFNLCKSMMRRGECPPLMVVFDPVEGFTVEADKCIKDWTIITEYVGDVDYLQSRENDDEITNSNSIGME